MSDIVIGLSPDQIKDDNGVITPHLFISSTTSTTSILEIDSTLGSLFGPEINNNDVIAALALPDGFGNGIDGIIRIDNSGTITTIADTDGPFTEFLTGPTINDQGTVAFVATRSNDEEGVFISDGVTITPIADTSEQLDGLDLFAIGVAIINNDNDVAFDIFLDEQGRKAMYVATSEGIQKVAASGDPLFGSTISDSTRALRSPKLNDNGQILFHYELDNGVSGLAVATLIPEPTSAWLLLIGVGFISRWRRPRRATFSMRSS